MKPYCSFLQANNLMMVEGLYERCDFIDKRDIKQGTMKANKLMRQILKPTKDFYLAASD